MEFWGVEVKAGQPLKVQPGEDKIIHLSQASLGEYKNKGSESIPLFLKFGDQKLVLGTLSTENFPQLSFDLVFEKEFELSHNWKHGSVYFIGYKAITPEEEDHDEFDTDSEEEEMMEALPLKSVENGKAGPVVATQKAALKPESTGKQVKLVEPSKDDEDDDSSDEDEDEDDLDEDDDDMSLELGDEDDDDSDEEPEETPKKAELGKKRPSDSASKTPVPAKKAKSATPQKTDGKKSVHTATPHPSKKAGKTPASNEKLKAQTPKSGSQVSCKTCSKTFNSEVGLQSHTKAKHGGS